MTAVAKTFNSLSDANAAAKASVGGLLFTMAAIMLDHQRCGAAEARAAEEAAHHRCRWGWGGAAVTALWWLRRRRY